MREGGSPRPWRRQTVGLETVQVGGDPDPGPQIEREG